VPSQQEDSALQPQQPVQLRPQSPSICSKPAHNISQAYRAPTLCSTHLPAIPLVATRVQLLADIVHLHVREGRGITLLALTRRNLQSVVRTDGKSAAVVGPTAVLLWEICMFASVQGHLCIVLLVSTSSCHGYAAHVSLIIVQNERLMFC
jgi:hypothetical protein